MRKETLSRVVEVTAIMAGMNLAPRRDLPNRPVLSYCFEPYLSPSVKIRPLSQVVQDSKSAPRGACKDPAARRVRPFETEDMA